MKINRLFLIAATVCSMTVSAQKITGEYEIPKVPEWAKNAVFYQIYPQTFCDSDGDGIGDLKGVISKLDYVKSLGVDAIWFNPFFDSPFMDAGYDIRDYRDIDEKFGTMADFDRLLEACHRKGLKVILDMVLNHTSTEHPWFQAAIADPDSKYRNYYIIRKGRMRKRKLLPPTNWVSSFTGSAWERIGETDDFYLHLFCKEQADLNWENPQVRAEAAAVLNFWLQKGVDGFRFDAAKYIYFGNNYSSVDFWNWYTGKLKEIKPDIYLVGEVWSAENEINQYIKEMNCFDFTISQAEGVIAVAAKGGDINAFTKYVVNYQKSLKDLNPEAMAIPFISNHNFTYL